MSASPSAPFPVVVVVVATAGVPRDDPAIDWCPADPPSNVRAIPGVVCPGHQAADTRFRDGGMGRVCAHCGAFGQLKAHPRYLGPANPPRDDPAIDWCPANPPSNGREVSGVVCPGHQAGDTRFRDGGLGCVCVHCGAYGQRKDHRLYVGSANEP